MYGYCFIYTCWRAKEVINLLLLLALEQMSGHETRLHFSFSLYFGVMQFLQFGYFIYLFVKFPHRRYAFRISFCTFTSFRLWPLSVCQVVFSYSNWVVLQICFNSSFTNGCPWFIYHLIIHNYRHTVTYCLLLPNIWGWHALEVFVTCYHNS